MPEQMHVSQSARQAASAADTRASQTPRTALLAYGLSLMLVGTSGAQASEERFRLLPGNVMQNDAAGQYEGTIGYAGGLRYQVIQGYAIAEGDMVLGRVDAWGRLPPRLQRRGLGQASLQDRWPDGIVPYAFHPAISEIQAENIGKAIEKLNAQTRLTLIPSDEPAAADYGNYILFEPSSGCASFVGRQTQEDAQSLWIADSCSVGSIIHEISHAIGLFHEHTRADRDNYVRIEWDNIIESKAFNFEIYDAGVEMYGEYDYGSIMHYGETFFSKNGERTIIPPRDQNIGQRSGLSVDDIKSLDTMYQTDVALTVNAIESDRGVEFDLSIVNQGLQGANSLELEVLGDAGTEWISVSAESGWECVRDSAELSCKRMLLTSQETSNFTVVAAAGSTRTDTTALRLRTRTLDSDPSNNGINEEAFPDEPEPIPAPILGTANPINDADEEGGDAVPESRTTPSDNGADNGSGDGSGGSGSGGYSGEPKQNPMASVDGSDGSVVASNDSGGGGGSGNPAWLLLLAALAHRRRRSAKGLVAEGTLAERRSPAG